jgi:hypothetical protein
VAIDRPSELEIRRALAECMTVGDIDDAMGWSPGTARRRRWRPLERGGLPSADAELGGVALWFRSTFESWQESRLTRAGRDRASGAAPALPPLMQGLEVPVPSQPLQDAAADSPPAEAGEAAPPAELTDDAAPSRVGALDEEGGTADAGADAVNGPEPDAAEQTDAPAGSMDDEAAVSEASDGEEPSEDDELLVEDEDEPSTDENLPGVESGFALDPGQRVLADVHGRWREAWVGHRDRATVVVDYNLDGTPLGARQLRISVSRVRIPNDG